MDKSKKFTGNNLLWILFLVTVLYCILAGIFEMIVMAAVQKPIKWSPAMHFVNEYYTPTIGAIIFLFLICWIVKKNHFILRSFLPAGKGKNHKIQVIEDTLRMYPLCDAARRCEVHSELQHIDDTCIDLCPYYGIHSEHFRRAVVQRIYV